MHELPSRGYPLRGAQKPPDLKSGLLLWVLTKYPEKGSHVSVQRIRKTRISRDLVVASVATALLVGLSVAFGGAPATRLANDHRPPLRLAYFPNLTHAPALVGIARGEFQRRVPKFLIEPRVVNAGPEAMEALLAGEVDVAYVGPSPAVNTFLKSGGRPFASWPGLAAAAPR